MTESSNGDEINSQEQARIKQHLSALFIDALLSDENVAVRTKLTDELAKDIEERLADAHRVQETTFSEQNNQAINEIHKVRESLVEEMAQVKAAAAGQGETEPVTPLGGAVVVPASKSVPPYKNPTLLQLLIVALFVFIATVFAMPYLPIGDVAGQEDPASGQESNELCAQLFPVSAAQSDGVVSGSTDEEASGGDVVAGVIGEPPNTDEGADAPPDGSASPASERAIQLEQLAQLACAVESE